MCAIFGIIGNYNYNLAKSALALMSHRGPDFCGIVQEEKLFFAHNLLRIMDNSKNARQPYSHKHLLVSFNGEIYNKQELQKILAHEQTDINESQLIALAYLKWKEDFVNHLRGMFAIAIKDKNKLYLFRDRLGKKPLFFHNGKSFVFASEIKAIIPFLEHITLNNDALLSYLSYLAPTPPHTFFQDIHKLAAGEFLLFENGKITIKRYFDILHVKPSNITSKQSANKQIKEDLMESLHLRFQTPSPKAILLSGGIDSAFIASVSKSMGHSIDTYTLGFNEYKNYDESDNAQRFAKSLGIKNRIIKADKTSFMDSLDETLQILDEPLNDPAAPFLNILLKHIKDDGYKVVFSGEGSDELFLGYRQYFEYLDIEKAASLAHKNWLKKYFRANFSMNREWEWYKRIWDGTLLFRTSGEKFTDLQQNLLLRQNIKDNHSYEYLKAYRENFEKSAHNDESIWYSYIDLNIFQAEHFLKKLDHVSMASSIEARTPFLDHKLVWDLFSIKPSIKYQDKITKSLLKDIASQYLDQKTLTRKKKGFSTPYMEWLIASDKISLINEVNEKTGIFNDKILNQYIALAKKGRFKQHTWGLYVLSCWLKKWLL